MVGAVCAIPLSHFYQAQPQLNSISTQTLAEDSLIPSRITNKWVKLGVPLVGCGDSSDVAHENL